MNITVVGMGYVGLSNSILLAQNNKVIALDSDDSKISKLKNYESPIADKDIEFYLKNKEINLIPTTDIEEAYKDAEFIIIATPTDYDPEKNYFNTKSVDCVISDIIRLNKDALIVIKSTLPLGYVKNKIKETGHKNIIFSPEFLREGFALHDNLYPSRIIIGEKSARAKTFGNLLNDGAIKKDIDILFTDADEAEAIKLFANTYLAMRIAYFNEIDTFCLEKNLDVKSIIDGLSLDARIGHGYNNPSYGYGGYCLPKDTKQLLTDFNDIPQDLISAIVLSNKTRQKYIAELVIGMKPKLVGIYRLTAKKDSDNFRSSAIQPVIQILHENNIEMLIYEPEMECSEFENVRLIKCLNEFKDSCDLILANRLDDELRDVISKVITRDIYGVN